MSSNERFPVVEQPAKCWFGERNGQLGRLTVYRTGSVVLTQRRSLQTEYTILLTTEGLVLLKSSKFDRYLAIEEETNRVVAHPLQAERLTAFQWKITKEKDGNVTLLCNGKYLALLPKGEVSATENKDMAYNWNLQFTTGELLFVRHNELSIRCNVLHMLSLTDDMRGWEVWRFVEADSDGDGGVYIQSWMHNSYLSSDNVGTVQGALEPSDACLWQVLKESEHGVTLRSAQTGRKLAVMAVEAGETSQKNLLCTVEDMDESTIWQLEPAHSQLYTFCASAGDEKLTVGPKNMRLTSNLRQAEPIEMQLCQGTNAVTIRRRQHYVSAIAHDENGEGIIGNTDEPFKWKMQLQSDGSYTFQSGEGSFLSFSECPGEAEYELCVSSTAVHWRLDPCLPRAVSSRKIRTFAVGTSIAVGTTILMPFAVAGIVGLMGAEMGVLTSIVAAGLTGAEALASVGVVGTTAALVFRQDDGSVSSQADKDMKHRPFCNWRAW